MIRDLIWWNKSEYQELIKRDKILGIAIAKEIVKTDNLLLVQIKEKNLKAVLKNKIPINQDLQ